MSKAKFIYFSVIFIHFHYISIFIDFTRGVSNLFVDNLDSQCVIIHRTKLEKERSGGGGREMFMQIDFIRKSCEGRPRIARKEWKFCASPFFCGRKICVFLFPPFYSFPERIFFLFFFVAFSLCAKLLFSPLNTNERSWFGSGL